MDINNDSGTDTRYTVKSSGGSGMAPHGHCGPQEDTSRWAVLQAGSTVQHQPSGRGPWQVCFLVEGQPVISAEAQSDSDQVNLVTEGKGLRAHVRRIPRATAKPV